MDTTLTVFISKASNSNENLTDSTDNLAGSSKNLAVSTKNLADSAVSYDILKELINKSLYKSDVKEKLLKIFHHLFY